MPDFFQNQRRKDCGRWKNRKLFPRVKLADSRVTEQVDGWEAIGPRYVQVTTNVMESGQSINESRLKAFYSFEKASQTINRFVETPR